MTYVRHEENLGVQFASNTGYKYAKGKYLAFIGDDDRWSDKSKLQQQVNIFENDIEKRYGIVTTDVKFITKNGSYIKNIQKPSNLVKHILDRNGIIYGSAALLRNDAFKMAGKFSEELPKGTDSDVHRRIIFLGYDVYFLEKDMLDYHDDVEDKMTFLNEKGINRTIIAQNYKLRTYSVLMNYYPSVKSKALYTLGILYFMKYDLNKNRDSIKLSRIHFIESIKVNPFNIKSWYRLIKSFGS